MGEGEIESHDGEVRRQVPGTVLFEEDIARRLSDGPGVTATGAAFSGQDPGVRSHSGAHRTAYGTATSNAPTSQSGPCGRATPR